MIGTETMFDAATYSEVRKPLLEARTLPSWCYTSEEFYKREVERVFLKTWSFAGRADEIPNAGDYLTVDMPGGSVVLIRGRDGAVRAFANTCRHRGTQLLSEEKGNCRAITCPYHSWVYGLDGRLVGAPNMEQTKFDKDAFGLVPLRLDSWAGFLFVNFSDSGPTLLEQLGDLPEQLGPYNHDDMICVKKVDYHVACNWKFLLENALEAYHTGTVHRTTLGDQQSVDQET
ncbi:MAG: aromatic ring-hydroxylating dioxygenase subunit alpha, partial [Alphaproteobacteria bacterium]|nr:aromatic ring-hydroxylating dioxygenase subunit alpha [Alphaproteobacteria bacterium]